MKKQNAGKTLCLQMDKSSGLKQLATLKKSDYSLIDFSPSDEGTWVILSPIEMSIKAKIEAVGVPLKDWDIRIYRGVLTGCNEAFVVDREKQDEILAACKTKDERQRTEEIIRPVLRGRDIKRYGYEDTDLYLINTHNGIKGVSERINIEDYPAIKQHCYQVALVN